MRFLGIDFGTKNIGLALSDEQGRFAYPYRVIPNTSRAVMTINGICEEEGVERIIIGDSRNYQGAPNPVSAGIANFKSELEQVIELPVELEPEVLSTAEANRIMGKDEETDARAAAIILKSYLDHQS